LSSLARQNELNEGIDMYKYPSFLMCFTTKTAEEKLAKQEKQRKEKTNLISFKQWFQEKEKEERGKEEKEKEERQKDQEQNLQEQD